LCSKNLEGTFAQCSAAEKYFVSCLLQNNACLPIVK